MAEGDAEQGEMEDEEGGEDGEDVELVSRVVVVQEVPGLAYIVTVLQCYCATVLLTIG